MDVHAIWWIRGGREVHRFPIFAKARPEYDSRWDVWDRRMITRHPFRKRSITIGNSAVKMAFPKVSNFLEIRRVAIMCWFSFLLGSVHTYPYGLMGERGAPRKPFSILSIFFVWRKAAHRFFPRSSADLMSVCIWSSVNPHAESIGLLVNYYFTDGFKASSRVALVSLRFKLLFVGKLL